MILTGETIRRLGIITPHVPKGRIHGMSYGEGLAGYDIRLGREIKIHSGLTVLGVSMEHFNMPLDVLGRVCDKSTLIRQGLRVGNSVIEPGWRGHLTLELVWHPFDPMPAGIFNGILPAGIPIAQVIFERIEDQTRGYDGKYQDQPAEPTSAILEHD